uniref:Uncharacterized protein n=1 Tax=Oncorhynchus mykiss TaxID=8022 RepID=A0A8C7UXD7_ONCMY
MDEESTKAVIEDTTVGIYIIKDHAASEEPEDTGIVLECIKVLQDLGNVAFAVAMLFCLMYFFQKVFMELNGENFLTQLLHLKTV